MRSLFEIACERCNSNDGNSACEAVVGELRATLLRLAAISPQVVASLPPNGGNGVIRGTTRRRHAGSQLLMLQNPHRRFGERRRDWRGLGAVAVGGGGAWPGFKPTRRAKLAARTTRGRAAAHGHIKQPGPRTEQPGPIYSKGPEAPQRLGPLACQLLTG